MKPKNATRTAAQGSRTRRDWEESTLHRALGTRPERRATFTTVSSLPIERLYTAEDLKDWDPATRLGFPGEPPFTRGVQPTLYRGRLWTMRQFAGFGTAEDTNRRFHYLLEHGQTGLSVAFDLPTLMGRDSDDPLSDGEVGREGVAIDTLADMEVLFRGIPLDKVSTSMTINAPAAVILAMYLAVAEKQGVPLDKLEGTVQNDILKEYIAQKEWIYPPAPSIRIITDMVGFCTARVPKWNTISISGYHIREAGSTAAQELAFTLADGAGYVQACIDAGQDVDAFAPRFSFFFNSHNDFFEEIAKLRAARRMWCTIMRDRFRARSPRSWMLRTHVQTAGCSLTAQQPYGNVVRVTIQALAAVLGGTQSLHTNALDETLALPTEDSARIALRTQQIIAEESGVANTVDPLAGSYFVESLTDRLEAEAWESIRSIDAMGGIVPAIEQGYPQREIAEASYLYQKQVDQGEKIVVGVNRYVEGDTMRATLLKIGPEVERAQVDRLLSVRRGRDARRHAEGLRRLEQAARGKVNLMPEILEAVRAYASVGEICETLKTVFSVYQEGRVHL
ncbi:MAG TPA: methylmalonyl-CoA mutase family protein [Candidatus Polarisedimenticolia bacterium]|jgi:methylmalonyl-CoA mutase N-terminal domain/subunit|nr:methylmalonyl-CoA mutase family protein [Candidatus Polarisedimenticolia bacterium]